ARVGCGRRLDPGSGASGLATSFQPSPAKVVGGVRVLQTPPKRAFDPNFGAETETYEGDVAFLLEVQLKKDAPAGPAELKVNGRYQTCNDRQCVPGKWEKTVALTIDPAAAAAPLTIPA